MLPHLQRLNVLLSELKRRHVFRAVTVYAVAAWALVEVASTVLPVFPVPDPDAILRILVFLVVLGFPVALVLAWAFDLTSEGVRRTGENESAPQVVRSFLSSVPFRASLVVFVLGFTGGMGWVSWHLWLRPGSMQDGPAGSAKEVLDPTRLAVLYLDDHSANGELAYLANGITESLIHELSRIEALQVVSRNGVKPYRELAIPVDSLARLLGVGSLVEGSVAGNSDRILVTVQLVDAASGMHLLSEEIESQGGDILTLKEGIVREAVRLLGQSLGREVQRRVGENEAGNPRAWDLFQQAQHLREDADTLRWALGDTTSAGRVLVSADSLLGEAASLDPRWVAPVLDRGWVTRTRAGLLSSSETTRDPLLLQRGMEYAEEALQRDPGNPGALALRGTIRVDLFRSGEGGGDLEALARQAEEDLRSAVGTDPGQAYAWVSLAELLRLRGEFSEASVAAEHALDADPFLINAEKEIIFTLSQVWLDLGDVERAERWTDEGRARFPAEPAFPAAKLVILAGRGGEGAVVDTAYALMAQVTRELGLPSAWRLGRLQVAAVLALAGLPDSATAVVEAVRSEGSTGAWVQYFEANVRVRLGQYDLALDLLEGYLEAMPHRRAYIGRDWWWEPLRPDPRFQRLVAEEVSH
jgi:TolB-like protein/tetratricopeptide (TPR) repeat protein